MTYYPTEKIIRVFADFPDDSCALIPINTPDEICIDVELSAGNQYLRQTFAVPVNDLRQLLDAAKGD